jgi:hypothetical protein
MNASSRKLKSDLFYKPYTKVNFKQIKTLFMKKNQTHKKEWTGKFDSITFRDFCTTKDTKKMKDEHYTNKGICNI